MEKWNPSPSNYNDSNNFYKIKPNIFPKVSDHSFYGPPSPTVEVSMHKKWNYLLIKDALELWLQVCPSYYNIKTTELEEQLPLLFHLVAVAPHFAVC